MTGTRHERWSENFKNKEHLRSKRKSKKTLYYLRDYENKLRYAIAGEVYQLHEAEDVLLNLFMMKQKDSFIQSNVNKLLKMNDLVKNTKYRISDKNSIYPFNPYDSSTLKAFKNLVNMTSSETSRRLFTDSKETLLENPSTNFLQKLDDIRNKEPKRDRESTVNSDSSEKITKKAKMKPEGNKDNLNSDFDEISLLSSKDEKNLMEIAGESLKAIELEETKKALQDTRLLCEFLYEIAIKNGALLVKIAQKFKTQMNPEEYQDLKEQTKDISESAGAAILSYLKTYSGNQELFRVAKDSKRGENGGAAGSG